MSEAATVPSLVIITSAVSEAGIACEGQTHRHRQTHRYDLVYVHFFKVFFENKNYPD